MDQQIKEKELSISNTEEKYRQLIEQAGDAIVVYSIDGSIHEFNNMLCTVSGYSRDECKELKLQDILIGKLIENPSLYELMIKGETVTLYRQFKKKDNVFVDMEIRVKSIGDEKFLAFARDITERKKAELALKESFE
nr:PAS domain S-box protein [Chitinophagaceae bacterium]